jgi:hypothetical protein
MVNGTMLTSLILSDGRPLNGTFINYQSLRLVSRLPIFRDACRRETRFLLSSNQNATFPARFRCCTHYDFHVLPKSREAFDQFALGNSSKLTT